MCLNLNWIKNYNINHKCLWQLCFSILEGKKVKIQVSNITIFPPFLVTFLPPTYLSFFHKTEILMVISRCLVCPNINLIKSYDILLLSEIFILLCLKMHHFWCKIPKEVLIPQKKTSCHVFKMGIFLKLFVAVMAHIIRKNADKKLKSLFIYFHLKIVDLLLSPF